MPTLLVVDDEPAILLAFRRAYRGTDLDVLTAEAPAEGLALGIAAGVRECLFQPSVTGKADGVGLGLSICKRLVEAHGGCISAGDAPGGGTVVRFTLPAAGRAAGLVPAG